MVRVFLDDCRNPIDCVNYMNRRIGESCRDYMQDWLVVKDHYEFCDLIKKLYTEGTFPELISLDHDLADEHYTIHLGTVEEYEEYLSTESREMTGYDSLIFLLEFCRENGIPIPKIYIHTMNNIAKVKMEGYLLNYLKFYNL